MPNPKRKHTRSRRDMRRASNWKISVPNIVTCPQCKSPKLPHRVCPECGFYDKELVLIKKEKPKKKEEKV
jgi:large subunit ribosomal protein L32